MMNEPHLDPDEFNLTDWWEAPGSPQPSHGAAVHTSLGHLSLVLEVTVR